MEAEDLGAPARDQGFRILSRCRGPSDSWLTLKDPISEWFQMCGMQRKRSEQHWRCQVPGGTRRLTAMSVSRLRGSSGPRGSSQGPG